MKDYKTNIYSLEQQELMIMGNKTRDICNYEHCL